MRMQLPFRTGLILAVCVTTWEPATAAWKTIVPESNAKGMYGKVSVGGGYNTDLKDSWDDGSLSNQDSDMLSPVYKVVAGYEISPNVSAEAAYHDLGKFKMSAESDGTGNSWAFGDISGEQEADGWSLSVTGRWPISERWTLVGTMGWFWWESKETYNEGGFISSSNESGSDVTFTGGLEFDHGHKDRIVYTAELGHNRVGDDSLDVISGFLGVLYRFP